MFGKHQPTDATPSSVSRRADISYSLPAPYGLIDVPVDPSPTADRETSASGTDKMPNNVDLLSIDAYYDALSQFITHCQTPMTIAVQGNWGSGKTTALNFVKEKIREQHIEAIEFNTWMYSQFDMDDSLAFSMIQEIVRPLITESPSKSGEKMIRTAKNFAARLLRNSVNAAGLLAGMKIITDAGIAAVDEEFSKKEPEESLVEQLKELRRDFSDTVDEFLRDGNHGDRIVIFIDDLDRVEPVRAIEILETLKIFLEVENCVFVLALDFDVVVQGVSQKYGTALDEAKARQFFDKIIQVPFNMPVGAFNIEKIITDELKRSGLAAADDREEVQKYLDVTMRSIGTNPRSLKRLVNSFELLQLILDASGEPLSSQEDDLPLLVYALLCTQAAYPRFNSLLQEMSGNPEKLKAVLIPSSPADNGDTPKTSNKKDKKLLEQGDRTTDAQLRKFRSFRRTLAGLSQIETQDDGDLINSALKLSQVTSVGTGLETTHMEGRLTSVDDIIDALRGEGSAADLLGSLNGRLETLLRGNGKPYSMASSATKSIITLYATDDAAAALASNKKPPRFCAVPYRKNALTFEFGNASKNLKSGKKVTPDDPDWNDITEILHNTLPREEDLKKEKKNGLSFDFRNSGYPYLLKGITEETMDQAAEILVRIYDNWSHLQKR